MTCFVHDSVKREDFKPGKFVQGEKPVWDIIGKSIINNQNSFIITIIALA